MFLTIATSYTQVSSKRISSYMWEYGLQASLTNSGPSVTGVTAEIIPPIPSNVVVIDGQVAFGAVQAGATVTGLDPFTVRIDRRYPADLAALVWNIQFVLPSLEGTGSGSSEAVGALSAIGSLAGEATGSAGAQGEATGIAITPPATPELHQLSRIVIGTAIHDGTRYVYQRTAKGFGNIATPGRRDLQRRKHVIPTDYRTAEQIRCRARIAAATAAWHELSDPERREWAKRAGKKPLSGFNLFTRDFCRHHPLSEF